MTLTIHLGLLEGAGLIHLAAAEPELVYLFRHVLIQDAAYHTLLRGQRQRWHLATAEVLEDLYKSQAGPSDLAPILAHHFSLGGDYLRAVRYLILAGDAAFGNYANAEAAVFYRQALDIASQPGPKYDAGVMRHLSSRYGRVLELTSRFDAALDHYRAMETTARQRGDKALELASVLARATIHSTANLAQDLPHAARLLEQASALAHDLGDAKAEANIKWTLMLNNSMAGGDPSQSVRHGQEALALARTSGDRNLTALILSDLWFSRGSSGQWPLAREELAEAIAIARELGNLTVVAECLVRISMTDMVAGQYDQSLAEMVEGIQTAEALDSNDMRALTRLCAGLIYADRGVMDRALEYSQESVRLGEMTNNVTVLIGTRSDLGRIHASLGEVEHGLALARRAAADGHRFPLIAPWASATVVRLRLLRGEVDGAAAELAHLPDYRQLMLTTGFVPMMWTNLALAGCEVALARDDPAGAALLAREMIEHFGRVGVLYVQPEARLRLGQALLALNQLDEAWGVLQTARSEAEALGSRRLLWPILSALASIAAQRGEAQAADLRRQARKMVDDIAGHSPTQALRQSFLAQPEVQALMKADA